MAQALRGVAGPLGVSRQPAHLLLARGAHDVEPDDHLLEIGRCVIDVVFLRVAEGGANVSGRVVDRDLVERREPRQLREQSKRGPHHQELKGRGSLLGPAAGKRLIGLDRELAHPALEMHVLDDPGHRTSRDHAIAVRLGLHLGAQALDLAHLLVEIDPTLFRPAHALAYVIVSVQAYTVGNPSGPSFTSERNPGAMSPNLTPYW